MRHSRKRGAGAPVEDRHGPGSEEWLARGRLFLVLDVLLTKGSVTHAAKHMGLHSSAVSRMLGQLRELLGDPIFIRSGRGLVPTPFAESLRTNIRLLASGIETLFERNGFGERRDPGVDMRFDPHWNVPSAIPVPPLAFRPAHLLEGEPSEQTVEARRLAQDPIETAHKRLARTIGIVSAGGTGRGWPLTAEEAEDAMAAVLEGDADPFQIGAFFSLIQGRGATAAELAGLVRAGQAHLAGRFGVDAEADLDWPCYMSPNYHNPPWFFHAANLIARAGYRVVLHGASGTGAVAGRHGVVADALGIPVCTVPDEIAQALALKRIAYVPLGAMSPQIYRLMGLHAVTESRSPINEIVHLLRPVRARASLLAVAKPSYKEIHRDTAMILGWKDLSILGSVRDVAQFTPFRSTTIYRLANGEPVDLFVRGMREPKTEARARGTSLEYWHGVWSGGVKDARAEQIIVSTAAAALLTLSGVAEAGFEAALNQAAGLWHDRLSPRP